MKIMLAVALAAAGAAAWAGEAPKAKAAEAKGGDLGAAAKTFAAKCSSCHGKEGGGNPGMAKAFKLAPEALSLTDQDSREKSAEALAKITSEGKGKMPAYKGKLKDGEIAALAAFIRSLKPQ